MKKRKGVTLVELILVILVMSVTMAALTPYIRAIYRTWEYGDRKSEMLQNGRVSMDKAVKMLRSVRAVTDVDPSGQGDYVGFIDQNGDSIVLFHNVSGSSYYVGTAGYARDNDFIMRVTDSSNVTTDNPFARSLASLNFIYLKETMDFQDPALTPEDVRAVKIDMSLSDPEGLLSSALPVSSLAYCRILGLEEIAGAWVAYSINGGSAELIKLDNSGTELKRITGFRSIYHSISVDHTNGSVWVWDQLADKITILDSDGSIRKTVPTSGYILRFSSNVVDGYRWCIFQPRRTADNNYLVKFDSEGSEVKRKNFGNKTLVLATVDPKNGAVWVGEQYGRHSLLKLNSNGTEIKRLTNFNIIGCVEIDPRDGSCWVAETNNGRIVKIDSNGNELHSTQLQGMIPSISVNPRDGSCWVDVFYPANEVVKISSEGQIECTIDTLKRPISISVDPSDGSCWVVDTLDDQIIKFSSNGSEVKRIGPFGGGYGPSRVATDYIDR